MYHRIGDTSQDRRYSVSPPRFEKQMQFLSDHGYHVASLEAFTKALEGLVSLPDNSVVLTFDDGFQETFEHAVPILKQFGYPATFFLVTGLVGKTNEWIEHRGYPTARLMGWEEAQRLKVEGFGLGSHTVSHPRLTEIDWVAARKEIEESKRRLEDRLGVPVQFFAYPYGLFDSCIRDLVREAGYSAACSTRAGFNTAEADRFALRRLDIYGTDSTSTFGRNLLFGENRMTSNRLIGYYMRRMVARFVASRT